MIRNVVVGIIIAAAAAALIIAKGGGGGGGGGGNFNILANPTVGDCGEPLSHSAFTTQILPIGGNFGSSSATEMIGLINLYRETNGLKPLQENPNIDKVAGNHAGDMFVFGYVNIVDKKGRNVIQQLAVGGVQPNSAQELVEGGLVCNGSTLHTFNAMIKNPTIRASLLDPTWTEIGAGAVGIGPYWCIILTN